MSQYGTDCAIGYGLTAAITGGTNIVTIAGGALLTNASAGNIIFLSTNPAPYFIGSVSSNTQLTLTANYPDTLTAADFVIHSDFTANFALPFLSKGDLNAAELITRALVKIDQYLAGENRHINLTLGGKLAVTAVGNYLVLQKKIWIPSAMTIAGAQVIGCGGQSGAGDSKIRISTENYTNPSGAEYFDLTIPAAATTTSAYVVPDPEITLPAESWLYVFCSQAGGHESAQILIDFA